MERLLSAAGCVAAVSSLLISLGPFIFLYHRPVCMGRSHDCCCFVRDPRLNRPGRHVLLLFEELYNSDQLAPRPFSAAIIAVHYF